MDPRGHDSVADFLFGYVGLGTSARTDRPLWEKGCYLVGEHEEKIAPLNESAEMPGQDFEREFWFEAA